MVSENGKILSTDELPEKAPTVPQAAHRLMEVMHLNHFSERFKLQMEVAIASTVLGQAQENLNNYWQEEENGQHLLETAKPTIRGIAHGLVTVVEAMPVDDQMRRAIVNEVWFTVNQAIDSRASSKVTTLDQPTS
jgi:hypothetical protein